MAQVTIKISRSIGEIGHGDWDRIYPDIPEGYGYLKNSEETLGGQFKFYYISVYENGRILCAAPLFVADYPLDTTLPFSLPRSLNFRAVICGSPTCEGRIGIARDASSQEMIDIIVREMSSIAERERAAVIAFKEFSADYDGLLTRLKPMGFHKFSALPSVELDLPFGSFEEYLNSLSKKTREDLRRKYRRVDGKVNIEMEVRDSLGETADEAYGLYLANLGRADMSFEKITRDFFKRLPENMPGKVKFFTWRIDGKLAAFSTCLVSGGVMVGEYLGFDYAVAYKYHLYFVAFRDKIRWCIANGIKRYETGALNYDPKKRLDYRFVPQYIYARHNNKAMNRILSVLIWLLEPQKHEPSLKSLRKAS